MARADLGPDELAVYRPAVREPTDFDAFWNDTLTTAASTDLGVSCEPVDTPYLTVEVFDVGFAGYGGDRIAAWFSRPRSMEGPLPVVVEFIGYGGGRDLPGEALHWPSAGFAHLLVDTRGQGSAWGGGGSTPDPHGSGPGHPGS